MSASWVAAASLFLFFIGYRYYSKFLAEKIYRLNPDAVTPAHQFEDGVDYVPANRFVLWGHHFTSIAGAAPIVGPAIGDGFPQCFGWYLGPFLPPGFTILV